MTRRKVSDCVRAGPLPRPAFCSFLATAVDPSPNPGGGVVEAGDRCALASLARMVGRPPSPALPPQTARGKGDAHDSLRSGIEFSSPPGFFGERLGEGAPCGRRPHSAHVPGALSHSRTFALV